ncbi:TetR/AcrR family transcriptional regulator [Mangrovimicrobium sediminis]|uniref:TetR/AcrR family transcriptional regulator n=1 Tax=Mangrovimicrobium sediminis TaxID=2562682 RepID=A0A4Z0LXM0_9GAMM|nr:TetR/AcrR family transcriptional regulator [Haliea sp. SAOS-164]TGD71825.1 TetR/AcrR family transcriptional regulator [Haliea sp. SAOS-164]
MTADPSTRQRRAQQEQEQPKAHEGQRETPSGRRHYLPAQLRREHILTTSREVFARSGLKGARTRELAAAAGINQSTLFEHFRSKEELFIAAVVEPLGETIDKSRQRMNGYAEAGNAEDLRGLLQAGMLENLHGMVEIYPLLVQALYSDVELGKAVYREHLAPFISARAEIAQDMLGDGIDARLLQLASFGMMFAVVLDRACREDAAQPTSQEEQQQELADIARQLTDLITLGAPPPKPK